MRPGRRDLELVQGDDYSHEITFVDSTETPIDYSGLTWAASITPAGSSPLVIDFDVDQSDANVGVIVISLDSADTLLLPRKCRWDMQGSNTTFLAGDAIIEREVTI